MAEPLAPWHAVLVAAALPTRDRGAVMPEIDVDGFAECYREVAKVGG